MSRDQDFIKRAAAALAKVMARPFDQTHGVPKDTTGRKKHDRPSVKVETRRKRQAKPVGSDDES